MQVTMQPPPYVPPGPELTTVAAPVPAAMVATVIAQHQAGFNPRQKRTMIILCGLQIAIGVSCIVIYSVLLSIGRRSNTYEHNSYIDWVGAGIWCGALYIFAGSLGVAGARRNRLGLIISSMVFSIISSLFLWFVVGFAALAIDVTADAQKYPCSMRGDPGYLGYTCVDYNISGYQAADSLLVILSIIEFVVSIWCSVLCCKGSCKVCCSSSNGSCCTCCCYGSSYGYQTPVVYAPVHSAGQQVIFVQQRGTVGHQSMGILPIQSCYLGIQQPVQVAHPAASALIPPNYQSGFPWQPEYSAAHIGNASARGADCSQRAEITKDEMAVDH